MSLYPLLPLIPLPLFHTPDPFQKGRAGAVGLFHRGLGLARSVSFIGFRAGAVVSSFGHHVVVSTVGIDPPPRPPFFRGAGGMHLSLLRFFSYPGPFQKGRAGAAFYLQWTNTRSTLLLY